MTPSIGYDAPAGSGGGAVTSVASRTGDVVLTAADVGAGQLPSGVLLPSGVAIPSNASAATQAANDNSTKVATTAYVDTADALKANLASPTFTGSVVVPTPTAATHAVTRAYAQAIRALSGLLLPAGGHGGVLDSNSVAAWATASKAQAYRFIAPFAGTIDAVSMYCGTLSGNYDVAIVDDGTATPGSRHFLYAKGSTAMSGLTANSWNNVAVPNLAVTQGQHFDILVNIDNTTATTGRWLTNGASGQSKLTTTYMVASGGATARLAWEWAAAVSLVTTDITEATLQATVTNPQIIAHITAT